MINDKKKFKYNKIKTIAKSKTVGTCPHCKSVKVETDGNHWIDIENQEMSWGMDCLSCNKRFLEVYSLVFKENREL
jgi:transcription elongation factor Elf1